MATETGSVNRKKFDDIKSSIIRPSLTSYFAVEIPLPPGSLGSELQQVLGVDQETMNLMCSETSLPGSQLATLDITNDATGVTEKHAYRRQFDDRIDFTFYVDAEQYLPIRFFETWMRSIVNEDPEKVANNSTVYRTKYPNDYIANQGLKIYKFERDYSTVLTYEFFRSFPLSISSMPVSYDGNNLLKCSVSMSYIRYVQTGPSSSSIPRGIFNLNQAINAGIPSSDLAEARRVYNETNASISAEARARGVTAAPVSLGGQFATESKVF